MTRVFATKVWGLDPDVWGALGFSKEGVRNSLAGEFKPDDYMLYIGTTGPQTAESERGRLLGLVKVESTHVSTEKLVERKKWLDHLEENGGTAKWPFGLPMTEVWKFTDDPLPDEKIVLPRLREDGLGMKMAVNYELLTNEEQQRVLGLPKIQMTDIFSSDEIEAARNRQGIRAGLRGGQGTSSPGPVPFFGKRNIDWKVQPAHFYCMELEGALAFQASGLNRGIIERRKILKLGWAIDPELRSRALNFSMPNYNALGWKVVFSQAANTQLDAYKIEQSVLHQLKDRRLPGKEEMVCCTLEDVEISTVRALSELKPADESVLCDFFDNLPLDELSGS